MKKNASCLLLMLLFGVYANAQQVKTMSGTVVNTVFGGRWSGIVIQVGSKRYGVQTSYEPSAGDESRGERGWQLKTVGSIDEGRQVQVFYTKVDCTANGYGDGVRCVLDATKIVEVKAAVRPIAPRGSNNNTQGLIGLLDNSNYRYLDGCGCYFRLTSASRKSNFYVFLAEIANPNGQRKWMNIDGRVITLNLVSSTKPSGRKKRGSTFTETYRSGDVTARITSVVTSPYRPDGEVEKYSATITVTKGNRSQTVKAVGGCGC